MNEYNFEIRKGHEAEDIGKAVTNMVSNVYPVELREHVISWVVDDLFNESKDNLRLATVQNYLNNLKIDGWTGDIAKIFEPYLDIAITKILERGATRLGVNTPDNEDLQSTKEVVRKFQGETNLSYNHMLFYFMEGATVYMLRYLLNDALEHLAQEEPKMFMALIEHFIPEAVRLRLKGDNDGQESDTNSAA